MIHRLVLACLLALSANACRTVATSPAERDYVWVELLSGPRVGEKSPEERQTIQAAHMANIGHLARERELLLAGPFGEPRRDPRRRGLFVFATPTDDEARRLTDSDPAVQQGVLAMELHTLRTVAPLVGFLERELALEAEAERTGRKRSFEEQMRAYVILVAEHGDIAERVLAPLIAQDKVLLFGRLDSVRAVAVLDARDLAEAQNLLGSVAERLGAHAFDPWFASTGVAELPRLGRSR
jgi:uncharacterized protein YciI